MRLFLANLASYLESVHEYLPHSRSSHHVFGLDSATPRKPAPPTRSPPHIIDGRTYSYPCLSPWNLINNPDAGPGDRSSAVIYQWDTRLRIRQETLTQETYVDSPSSHTVRTCVHCLIDARTDILRLLNSTLTPDTDFSDTHERIKTDLNQIFQSEEAPIPFADEPTKTRVGDASSDLAVVKSTPTAKGEELTDIKELLRTFCRL